MLETRLIFMWSMNLCDCIFVCSCVCRDRIISFIFCYTYLCVEYYPGKSDYIATPVDFPTLATFFWLYLSFIVRLLYFRCPGMNILHVMGGRLVCLTNVLYEGIRKSQFANQYLCNMIIMMQKLSNIRIHQIYLPFAPINSIIFTSEH